MLGWAIVDVQSASDPAQIQVTSVPSPLVHVHFVTDPSAAAEGADTAPEDSVTEAVVDEPQPARKSAPAAAMETAKVVTNLGECIVGFSHCFHAATTATLRLFFPLRWLVTLRFHPRGVAREKEAGEEAKENEECGNPRNSLGCIHESL